MTNDYGEETGLIMPGDRVEIPEWDQEYRWGTVIEITNHHNVFWVQMDDPTFPDATFYESPEGVRCYMAGADEIYSSELMERTIDEKYELLTQRIIDLEHLVQKLANPLRGA